jgi:hypothetical protein
MTTGTPAILLVTPAAAGLGNRGASGGAREATAGATWAPIRRLQSESRPCPRPGVPSSTPAAARCTAAPPTALARGGGPPHALSARPVSAVQRSDLAAAAIG